MRGAQAATWLLFVGCFSFAASVFAEDEDRHRVPVHPEDLCELADSNLARAKTAILSAPRATQTIAAAPRWNHRSAPRYLDVFERRFTLTAAERALLFKQGFVVPARLHFSTYSTAYHEIYQSQLPIYVSVDSILHAVYAVNDSLIADLEHDLMLPRLMHVVSALRTSLPSAAANYPAETTHDLDVYLTVAAQLLGDAAAHARGDGTEREVKSLLSAIRAARELAQVELFGRARMIDFSQYVPRGHYTAESGLVPFFLGAMWLSRLELNLVSRSSRSSAPGHIPDPRETPREAVLALSLADLAQRTQVLGEIDELDQAWTLLGGQREDISLSQLVALREKARISDLQKADAAERLRGAIGDRFQRLTPMHYMPEGSQVLPAIATLLGPRAVADTTAIRPLVHSEISGRYRIGVADMAYALGYDPALGYLRDDLGAYPTLRGQLDKARVILTTERRRERDGTPAAATPSALYSAWLRAARGLTAQPTGTLPSFMQSAAFADLRMNSIVGAFGQLRHNYVLIAGQGYEQGGCEIPDGYVEPVPAVYDALIEYAQRGERALATLDPQNKTDAHAYFVRLTEILRVLRSLVDDELANRPLSTDARRFLSMVAEMTPGTTGGPATYTGWYFDLFRRRVADSFVGSDFIADFYTSVNLGEVAYAGVSGVRLGLFVVDTGGPPRLMIGPVARSFEHHGPLSQRLDDHSAQSLPDKTRVDSWAKSYTVPIPPGEPALTVGYSPESSPDIAVEAPHPVGPVTFTLLDHHRAPLASLTRNIGTGKTTVRVPAKSKNGKPIDPATIGGLSLRIGEFYSWAEVSRGGESGLWISMGASDEPQ